MNNANSHLRERFEYPNSDGDLIDFIFSLNDTVYGLSKSSL